MTPAWPHGDPWDVVRSIVADPRFSARSTSAPSARRWWLDDVLDGLAHALRAIFHALNHALGPANSLAAVIGFAAILAAVGLFGYCLFLFGRSYTLLRRRRPAAFPAGGTTVEPAAAALRSAALGAARAGRFRAAAALLFSAAVRGLDERGRVAYDPARTAGEYRRIVRDPLFDALAADAVVALYAEVEPRNEVFERMNDVYDRFFDLPRP